MSQYFKNDSINLSFLFSRILSHWYYFVVIAPIILSLAFIYVRGADKISAFHGTILISPSRTGAQTTEEMLGLSLHGRGDYRKVATENESIIMSSYNLVKQSIAKLDFGVSYYYEKSFKKVEFYHDAPFVVNVDSSANQLVGVKISIEKLSDKEYKLSYEGENKDIYLPNKQSNIGKWSGKVEKTLAFGMPYKSNEMNLSVSLIPNGSIDPSAKYYFMLHSLDDLTYTYKAKLKIKVLVTDSYVLEVRTEGTTHDKEIVFIDTLMGSFIKYEIQNKNLTGVKTLEFVTKQFEEATKELVNAQQQLQNYKTNKKLVSFENQSGSVFNNIERLEKEKSEIVLKLQYYKDIATVINDEKRLANARQPSLANIKDDIFANLLAQFNNTYQEKLKLELYSKEKSINLQDVNIRLNALQQSLSEYISNNIRELTEISLSDVNTRINDAQNRVVEFPENQSILDELTRRVEFHKKRYEFFLSKKEDAEINLATSTPDSRIVDSASNLGKVSPNTQFIYFVSALLSMLVPIGLIILKDMVNDKIRNKEELLEVTKIPMIGTIAKGDKKTKVILKDKPHSLIAETFRTLRTNLDYLSDDKGKVLAVTSALASEGKTFCSVNVSTAFAIAGKKTLLVCADLRKSSIKNYFNLQDEGMTEFLSPNNTVPMNFFIQKTEIPNLDIISAGKHTSTPSELLSSERMKNFIEEVKGKYDKIIIDTPPITFVADYFTINNYADITLYMVRAGFTKTSSLDPISEMYEKGKIKNIRIVLNDFKFPSSFENSYVKGGYATTAS